MKPNHYSRRTFFQQVLASTSLFVTGATLISSCGSTESEEAKASTKAAPKDCDDLSGVSKAELEKREKFGYIKQTQIPDSACGNCGMYVPGTEVKDCGTCLLFQGPVHASGYCIQYVAKQ